MDENIPSITFRENIKLGKDAKIEPIKREEEKGKQQKSIGNKHPWDIAQEIITEQNQASLAIKWSAIPHETLFDEQFLRVLHAVEELTDIAPLKDAMTQLPKNIYEIIKQYEHIPKVTTKSTDDLIYNLSKTYFHSVIESLCKFIRSIQQEQRTSLVSMARVINEQKEIIEEYQGLTELPNQIKKGQSQLQKQIDQMKEQTATQLERVDKRAITTYTIISDIKSQIKKRENTLENTGILVEQSERPGWESPEDIVELHAPDENEFFHTDDEVPLLESEETNIQTPQQQNTQSQEGGEIPDRLSPIINYIPARGEEGETASSQESALDLETTVEDGLADFFHNPSYRSTDPSLRQSVETEEDWGDTPPIELSDQISTLQPRQNARFEKRQ